MEQRIRPNTAPVHAAGTDPAYIPGLTGERPPERKDSAPPDPAPPDPASAAESTAESTAESPAEGPDRPAAAAGTPGAADGSAAEEAAGETVEEAAGETVGKGTAFEVRDHRGSITADRTGVTFRLDEETAEFDWDEIGAVEIAAPRFAKRFSVTVYTTGRRRYDADVDAPERRSVKVWTEELEAVLDEYFEDTASQDTAAQDTAAGEAATAAG